MTKKEFFTILKEKLSKYSDEEINFIIDKYNSLILEGQKDKKKVKDIIESFGKINILISKIKIKLFLLRSKRFTINTFTKVKQNIKKVLKKKKKSHKNKTKKIVKKVKKDLNKTKEIKPKNKGLKILYEILIDLLLLVAIFSLLWLSMMFVASLYAILDGVKMYGLALVLMALTGIDLLILIILNRYFNKQIIDFKKCFYIFIGLIILLGGSLGITIMQYYKFDNVDKVDEKYQMYKDSENYNLSKDKEDKFYIYFNSWYKSKYNIEIDNSLDNEVRIEVRYYECYYDLHFKKDFNSVYISLNKDTRDIISIYLDNFKDKKIYNQKELSRYTIKIFVNEIDKDRIVFSE